MKWAAIVKLREGNEDIEGRKREKGHGRIIKGSQNTRMARDSKLNLKQIRLTLDLL